jgi:hypothetical protein
MITLRATFKCQHQEQCLTVKSIPLPTSTVIKKPKNTDQEQQPKPHLKPTILPSPPTLKNTEQHQQQQH